MRLFRLKGYSTKDTIAAIATFPSVAALGVIKISGPRALEIIAKIFRASKEKDIRRAKTHTLHYGWIVSREGPRVVHSSQKGGNKALIDEVLVSVMRAPRTYTRENVVEISSHGGAFLLDKILRLLISKGARLARPGEFTYRAMLNGRLNLLQAESVASLIDAKSDEALTQAIKQLQGGNQALVALRRDLKEVFSRLEAMIHFPEDHIVESRASLKAGLLQIEEKVHNFLQASVEGRLLQEGLRCVICGKANVGKSTLFNLLLKKDRAIVSSTPGTTRDVVEEMIRINGASLRLYDTAGILEPRGTIERKAVQKTKTAFQEADLVLLVFDNSKPLTRDDLALLGKIGAASHAKGTARKNVIIVLNKIDLPRRLAPQALGESGYRIVRISAKKDKGIRELEHAIARNTVTSALGRVDALFLSHYQRVMLEEVSVDLKAALDSLDEGHPVDLIGAILSGCVNNIGKLTGEIFCEEVMESVFSKFCIGK
ncbi:MAG: tRNA uridine-5-carboxymethylaminomethyl(34) synthesis GTPase MnmE [Candidatus Omnitrophota bacterium]